MTNWYQHMVNILRLNGKGERTQQAYTRGAHAHPVLWQNARSGDRAGTSRITSSSAKTSITGRVRALIERTCGFISALPKAALQPRQPTCPSCGGPLKFRSLTPPMKVLRWSG